MSKILLFFSILVIVILVGGGVFLATWNVPSPNNPIEKVIPNAQLGK